MYEGQDLNGNKKDGHSGTFPTLESIYALKQQPFSSCQFKLLLNPHYKQVHGDADALLLEDLWWNG